MLKVATVIPAYRPDPTYLAEVLNSLERQTVRPSQVVVVDDGSPEPVFLPETTLPIRLVRQENAGVSSARNAGVEYTTTPLVHVLDQDERLEPEFYERLVPFFDDPAVAVAHSRLRFMGPDGSPLNEFSMPAAEFKWTDNPLPRLLQDNPIGSSAALFRRSAWESVRGFAPYRFTQDWYFWLRLAAHGAEFRYNPEVLCWHRRHDRQETATHREHLVAAEAALMLGRVPVPARIRRARARGRAKQWLIQAGIVGGWRAPILVMRAAPWRPRGAWSTLRSVTYRKRP